ncbi:MAG: DUF2490 domain-containing protein [Chitinophagaceae bacterium]
MRYAMNRWLMLFCICLFCVGRVSAQKQVNNYTHSWIGLLSTFRFGEHWGATGDLIIRREDFVKDPGYYFLRVGGGYWFNNSFSLTTAYSNLWLYRPELSNKSFTREQRFDVQLSLSRPVGRVSMLNRFRADSRWREQVENNQTTGAHNFSERIRYLYSLGIPVSTNPKVPVITFTNEVLLQFGKQIVYNPLDQLRVFTGIRQNIGKGWSYDFGYMLIYQQAAAGNVYNLNHTIRLLVYFVHGSKRTNKVGLEPLPDEE